MFEEPELSTDDEDYINMLEDRYKELKAENDALKERIEELEAKIAEPTILDTIQDADKINALVVQISDAAVELVLHQTVKDDWRLQAFGRDIEGYIEAAFAEERSRIEKLEAELEEAWKLAFDHRLGEAWLGTDDD